MLYKLYAYFSYKVYLFIVQYNIIFFNGIGMDIFLTLFFVIKQ